MAAHSHVDGMSEVRIKHWLHKVCVSFWCDGSSWRAIGFRQVKF